VRRGALLFAIALALAACGGGDEAATTAEPPTTGTPAETGTDELPAIVVDSPAPGATVTSPVTIAGSANVFEANVTVIVLDATGAELAQDFTTATCGTGCRGDYSIELAFETSEEQAGTIVVQDDDAAGTGTPPHRVEVPVTLSP
jgi:hypothetical protein